MPKMTSSLWGVRPLLLAQLFMCLSLIGVQVIAEAPKTTADPNIVLDYLDLMLDPLTKEELTAEALAWRDLVKAKAQNIAHEEILIRKKNHEIAAASKSTEHARNTSDRKKEQKELVMEDLVKLREERTALLARFKLVLDALAEKGGDVEDLRKYAAAVSGIKVEVTDTTATWMAFKGWLSSKEGGIRLGLDILKVLTILLVFWFIGALLSSLVQRATSHSNHVSSLLKSFLNKFVKRMVVVIGVMVALSTLGINLGALLALVGGGAFILGFALQDTLGNFAAGMMLLFYRPFDVGDVVEVGGVFGTVDNVSLVNTTIRTFDNKVVLVPNKQVWGQVITNATASDKRRVDMIFGISYSSDLEQAHSILHRLVDEHDLVLRDPEPVIELHQLGESSVDFVCRPWTLTGDYWRVYWDITKAVKQAFDEAGISIPFPQRDVHIYQQPLPASPQTIDDGKPEKNRHQSPLDAPEQEADEAEPQQ